MYPIFTNTCLVAHSSVRHVGLFLIFQDRASGVRLSWDGRRPLPLASGQSNGWKQRAAPYDPHQGEQERLRPMGSSGQSRMGFQRRPSLFQKVRRPEYTWVGWRHRVSYFTFYLATRHHHPLGQDYCVMETYKMENKLPEIGSPLKHQFLRVVNVLYCSFR